MILAIASDHGGFVLKRAIARGLQDAGHTVIDHGPQTDASCDYPALAEPVGLAVASGAVQLGILVCGSGIGMSIAANKVAGIRAAVVQDVEHARLARQHNSANVLCLGGRFTTPDEGLRIVTAWLEAEYEGGRHDRRLALIAEIETSRLHDCPLCHGQGAAVLVGP